MPDTRYLDLPTIDFETSIHQPELVGKQVVNALEAIGFLGIKSLKDLDFQKIRACCSWFFRQPMAVKESIMRRTWKKTNKNVYRGYFPVLENEPSRKEGFEFARDVDPNDTDIAAGNWFYELSSWPEENGEIEFKQIMLETYEAMHNVAMHILKLTSIGMGIREDAFDHLFKDKPCSTFRLLHYPPWDGAPPDNAVIEDGKVVTTPDHTDSNFLTLLTTFEYEGLEVLTPGEIWKPVKPLTNGLVMNVGDLFSKMVGGRFRATRHRVLDIGIDRFSVPFFLEPRYDADIGVNIESEARGKTESHKVELYGPWVIARMERKQFFEFLQLPKF